MLRLIKSFWARNKIIGFTNFPWWTGWHRENSIKKNKHGDIHWKSKEK